MREGGEVEAAASSGIAGRKGCAHGRGMAAGMWIAAAAALMGAAPAVPTVAAGEIVLPRADARFVLHQATVRAAEESYEYRLRGDISDMWSRAIIVTRSLHPLAVREAMRANASASAVITLAGMAAAIELSCPTATVKVTPDTQPKALASATLRARCQADATTHEPALTRVRAITGPEGMHIVMVVKRGSASREDEEWADHVIANVIVCAANEVEGRCAARSRVIGGAL